MEFSYFMPTKLYFGVGCIKKNGSAFKMFGKKALIVTGRSSARMNGSLDDICTALDACGVQWEMFDRVEPNPPIENVRAGADIARKTGADFVIGIGGGSPMDAAKGIAALATNEKNNSDLFSSPFENEPLPVVAVPTTAGTGSEVTQYSILTDTKEKTKKNLSAESLFPRAAFLDASYMDKLPWQTTVNTAIDALSHSVESYMSGRADVMSSLLALESMRCLGDVILSMKEGQALSLKSREKLLYGSMLGGMAIAQTGTTVVHAMGYSLTFFNGIDHGMANGLLLCSFLTFASDENNNKIKTLLKAIGVESVGKLDEVFQTLIGTYKELDDDTLRMYSDFAIKAKSVKTTVPMPDYNEILAMYKNSVGN